jgi:hypothetical protein
MATEKIFQAKAELTRMAKASLLKMAFRQKEKNCVLGGNCPFLLEYRSILFCVSEIMGKGCQVEQLRLNSDEVDQRKDEYPRKVEDSARHHQEPLAGLWDQGGE